MTDIDYRLTNQVDPLLDSNELEKKQIRGFELTGAKKLTYLGSNQLSITELPSGVEYVMEFITVSKILTVAGFDEKKLKLSLEKLVAYHDVYYRFDKKLIYLNSDPAIISPVVAQMSNAVQNYNPELGGVEEEMTVDEIRLVTNKI